MHNLTIAELVKGLRNKEFTSVELTRHFLDRIASLDPAYNSVITVTAEQALPLQPPPTRAGRRQCTGTLWRTHTAQGYLLHRRCSHQLRLKDAG